MINLIKNELIKLFSKKAIYIYSIIIFGMLIFMSGLAKNLQDTDTGMSDFYIQSLEEDLSSYDLTDSQELRLYVGDRTIIDVSQLANGYKYEDPEYYYINEVIQPLILEKYQFEYIDKDLENAKVLQSQIEEEIKKIDKFDWKSQILDEKAEVNRNIRETEELLNLDKDNQEYNLLLETLKIDLWCLDYRLDKEVPYSYGTASNLIDTYKTSAVTYISSVKDESLIKNRNELISKRENEEQYYVSLYRLQNGLIDEKQNMISYIVDSMAYIDGLIVIAIIIISGSIVSEEFSKGTIKQLLTKPFGRNKILTSKIIASLIAIVLFIFLYETVFLFANCYEYSDFTSIFGTNVVYDFNVGKVKEVSVLGQCLYGLLSVLPAYFIIYVLILIVGVLTTNTVGAMCTGFGVFFLYDLLSLWLNEKILSFVPFYTWDLTPYMYGGLNGNEYASFGKSLLIDIITIVILLLGTYWIFKRKDIKNQ